MSPPSMICTGQSERSLYTCSARVGEICPNLFAEGAAIGSPDYFALCMITLQRGAIRGLVAGWDSGIRPCLFQQTLDYKKSGRVRSLGRTSFAFITIVKGPGQKEVAREWKILRSWKWGPIQDFTSLLTSIYRSASSSERTCTMTGSTNEY